ncbi:MAG TPA: transporter [Polyangiaceae bacterium]
MHCFGRVARVARRAHSGEAVGLVLLFCERPCSADEVVIHPDRPGVTNPPTVVNPAEVGIEVGAEVDWERRVPTYDAPSALLRVGFLPRSEIRLAWDGYEWSDGEQGGLDPSIGAKVWLFAQNGLLPETGVLGAVSVPVGAKNLSSGRFDPSFSLLLDHALSDRWGLGYNLGVEWQTELTASGQRKTQRAMTYSVNLGFCPAEIVTLFAEVFGDVGLDKQGYNTSLDTGIGVLVHPQVALDASGGAGLTKSAPDFFVSAGVSLLLPE